SAAMRRSKSWSSISCIERPTTNDSALVSSALRRPSPSALQIAAIAAGASSGLFIGGIATSMGAPFRTGQKRSSNIRRQVASPARARSTAFSTSCSARSSPTCSAIRVILFLDPGGRPGLPGLNGRPRPLRSVMVICFSRLSGWLILFASQPGNCLDVFQAHQGLVFAQVIFTFPQARDSRLALLLKFSDDLGGALVVSGKKEGL